jgi:hypothetical protein
MDLPRLIYTTDPFSMLSGFFKPPHCSVIGHYANAVETGRIRRPKAFPDRTNSTEERSDTYVPEPFEIAGIASSSHKGARY